MKKNGLLKTLIVLVIVAICAISFVGIYKKQNMQMINVMPEYKLSMNLDGLREIILKPSDETEEVIYDSEGNVTEEGLDEEGNLKEGFTKQNEKVNKDEVLTQENYINAKVILEERLETLGVDDYKVKLDTNTGEITIDIPEDSNTDTVTSSLISKGKFEILDSETQEVLINNNDVEKSEAVYANTDSGTVVYLSVKFNAEGKKKFEEITKKYIESTDEEGNDTTKEINIKLDDESLLETHFDETVTTGVLQLSVGNSSTDVDTINSYLEQASNVAALIKNQKIEIQYELDNNTYLFSPIEGKGLQTIILVIALIIAAALIYQCIRYRIKGILASISYIGFIGVLLLILRFANVIISLEGIIGLIAIFALNYAFNIYMLKKLSKKEEQEDTKIIKEVFKHYTWILLPILLISIVFTFSNWTGIASTGMIMFWGIIIILAYNYLITKTLLEK